MSRLNGKLAVVTGGGSGIGLGIAERFAQEGANVVIVGRRQQRLDEAVRRIGPRASAVSADVGVDTDLKRVFDGLARVDLLVTCAGTALFGPVEQVPPQAWRDLFAGRFFGQLAACHYAVPKMPPGSAIMLCSGVAGRAGLNNYSGGSALCGGINAMGRALAVELVPKGIRVNVLSPGLIGETGSESNLAGREADAFFSDLLNHKIPMKRAGRPADMAEGAMFLATCAYANGMVLDIDGGWTAS